MTALNDTGYRIYSSTAWKFNTLEVRLIDRGFVDINPVLFGSESFEHHPDRRANGVIYDCFLMHYVSSGCGTFSSPRGTFPVHAGQCFIIRPMEISSYGSDQNDPWKYIWLGITGKTAERLSELPDVVDIQDASLFMSMERCRSYTSERELYLAGRCSLLFAEMFDRREGDEYQREMRNQVKYVLNYIHQHYMEPITIGQVAEEMHLDRHYLSKLFCKEVGMTMKAYLTKMRMNRAKTFLENGYLVTETAALCGYNDVFNFSRMYKKYFGESPSGKQNRSKQNDSAHK